MLFNRQPSRSISFRTSLTFNDALFLNGTWSHALSASHHFELLIPQTQARILIVVRHIGKRIFTNIENGNLSGVVTWTDSKEIGWIIGVKPHFEPF